MKDKLFWTIVALAGIWIAVAIISIFSPDLVSGSEQEHLPVAAFITWISGAVATKSVLNDIVRRPASRNIWMGIAIVTVIIWLAVTLVSVFVPVLVTGSDPTRLPLAAILAPIGGAIVTGIAGDYMQLLMESPEPE